MCIEPCFVYRDMTFGTPVRALHSLTEAHASAIAVALPTLSGRWSMEFQESYDGNLSLILMPETEDAAAPTLAINRDATGLHLDVVHRDMYAAQGHFGDIQGVIEAIKRLVGDETSQGNSQPS
jgi:hypothetical protein